MVTQITTSKVCFKTTKFVQIFSRHDMVKIALPDQATDTAFYAGIVQTVKTVRDTRQEYPVPYLRVIEGDLCESDDHRFLLHDHWFFRLKGHCDRFALLRVEMTRHWLKQNKRGEREWVGEVEKDVGRREA